MIVRRLFISPAHHYIGHHGQAPAAAAMREVTQVECVAGKGLWGDRYFDHKENYKGQVTFFSLEVWEALCERFAITDKGPDVFRRNVLVSDCDLNALIGEVFAVGEVQFQGTEEARPCRWMNAAFCEGAEEALRGRGGLRARIVTNGLLSVAESRG